MTPKEELIQALLNTSNISAEAAELLNNIVNGESSGGGVLMVELSQDPPGGTVMVANKTANEILDAIKAGKSVVWHWPDDDYYVNKYGYETATSTNIGGNKEIEQISFNICWGDSYSFDMYTANSLDDYPSYSYD